MFARHTHTHTYGKHKQTEENDISRVISTELHVSVCMCTVYVYMYACVCAQYKCIWVSARVRYVCDNKQPRGCVLCTVCGTPLAFTPFFGFSCAQFWQFCYCFPMLSPCVHSLTDTHTHTTQLKRKSRIGCACVCVSHRVHSTLSLCFLELFF